MVKDYERDLATFISEREGVMSKASRRREAARQAAARPQVAQRQKSPKEKRWYHFGAEFLVATALAIFVVVYTMSWSVKTGLLLFLAALLIHCLWIIPREIPIRFAVKVIGTIAIILGLLLSIILVPKDEVPAPLLAAQIRELDELQKFIGRDENDLRELFDLPNAVKYSLEYYARQINPSQFSKEQSSDLDNYLKTASGMMNTKYLGPISIPHPGRINVTFIPTEIGVIFVSPKFTQSKNTLMRFEKSSDLPSDIQDSVKGLDNTIDDFTDTVFSVFNGKLREDPNFISFAFDPKAKDYYMVVDELCRGYCKPLTPEADIITAHIRKYLRVD